MYAYMCVHFNWGGGGRFARELLHASWRAIRRAVGRGRQASAGVRRPAEGAGTTSSWLCCCSGVQPCSPAHALRLRLAGVQWLRHSAVGANRILWSWCLECKPLPRLALCGVQSDTAAVNAFYSAWTHFASLKSFSWADMYNPAGAPNR